MAEADYQERLERELGGLADGLPLPELQRHYLRSRWLEQLLWMESKAVKNQRYYYALRIVAILGGVLVPALVSLDIGRRSGGAMRWAAFGVGLGVAAAVALDGFFRFGDRWRHYRRVAELLKAEGWQFFELAGHYQEPDHGLAFPAFAARTEEILGTDVETFVSVVAKEKPPEARRGGETG